MKTTPQQTALSVLIAAALLSPSMLYSIDGFAIDRENCPDGSDLRLIADGENGNRKIDLELELDDAEEGDRYKLILRRNGRRLVRRIRTVDDDEEIALNYTIRNRPGVERIRGIARNLQTGQVCRVRVRFRA